MLFNNSPAKSEGNAGDLRRASQPTRTASGALRLSWHPKGLGGELVRARPAAPGVLADLIGATTSLKEQNHDI